MSDTLKPCPFCGSEAELCYKKCSTLIAGYIVFGSCTECPCRADSVWISFEPKEGDACWQNAAEIWNNRPIEAEFERETYDIAKDSALQQHTIGKQEEKIEQLERENAELKKLVEQTTNALRLVRISGKKTMSAVAWQAVEAALKAAERGLKA